MIEPATIALAEAGLDIAYRIIMAALAARNGAATNEQLDLLRAVSHEKVNNAVAEIDAALAKKGK